MRTTTIALLLVLGAGCAPTPYQPMAPNGGYADSDLGGGRHRVTVKVNSNTDRGTALEYLHRRAGELCPDGYDMIDRLSGDNRDEFVANDSKPEVNAIIACRGGDRGQPTEAARLPPPPRYFCAWSSSDTSLGVCSQGRDACATARAELSAAEGAELEPCRDAISAVCFRIERDGLTTSGCAPTPAACARRRAAVVARDPAAPVSACGSD